MAFLNQDSLAEVLPECINPFDSSHLKSGAYELSLGNEYFTTSSKKSAKKILKQNEQLIIEPGHFALLITKEAITIPSHNIGFISIKAGTKFLGLINISGFHVDPGFVGKLKFSVYNAGSRDIILTEGQKLFPLWLAEFNSALQTEQLYNGKHKNQNTITAGDIAKISGKIYSPSVLSDRIKDIDNSISGIKTTFAVVITLFVGIVIRLFFIEYDRTRWEKMEIEQTKLKTEIDSLHNHINNLVKTQILAPAKSR